MNIQQILLLVMTLVDVSVQVCNLEIYCVGDLLHQVQMAAVFHDSKTFVDLKLKYPPELILKNFDELKKKSGVSISRTAIDDFVKEHFEGVESEIEKWFPPDWSTTPKMLNKISDPDFRTFARKLHAIWRFLGRKIKSDVQKNPDRYSMVYVPNAVIVPGGRFREFYYWDSYWIIKGLLHSEMYSTAKGMIQNYVEMVRLYGLVPNGGRVYYTGRSQPPMLIPMCDDYYKATGDKAFLKEQLPLLEEEFSFWLTNRTVKVKKGGREYNMVRFNDETQGPRPESYREDHNAAALMATDYAREDYYAEIKAGAESGRDFSSRWFIFNGTNKGDLFDTKVRYIIPVDLNGLVEWNARLLSEFCTVLGLKNKAAYYHQMSDGLLNAVENVLWHDDVGAWLDWDMLNGKRRNYFYPSNLAPLWTGTFRRGADKESKLTTKIINYLNEANIHTYPGGIPSSLEPSGEQWDFPNVWAPNVDMIITGLSNLNDNRAKELARVHASRYVNTMYKGFVDTKAMYEKYDATSTGAPGGGGEYINQIGFGWTNGVALDLLVRYGKQIVPPPKPKEVPQVFPIDDEIPPAASTAIRPTLGLNYKILCLITVTFALCNTLLVLFI